MTTLEKLDGAWCLKDTDADSRDPVIRTFWWKVLQTSGWLPCYFRPDSGGDHCLDCGQYQDSAAHDVSPDARRVSGHDGRYGGQLRTGPRYTVTIDPRAQAVKIEHTPIPCPKVRAGVPTRYRGGAWEKYLKSAGWVSAQSNAKKGRRHERRP